MTRHTMSDRDALRKWQHAGLTCAMIDSGIGFINGYVQIPESHAAFGASYDQINRTVSIHGGLTYGTDADGWVGFDTGHSGDVWPGAGTRGRVDYPPHRIWSTDRLAAETESLAEQLASLTELSEPESSWDCTEDEFDRMRRQALAWKRLRRMHSRLGVA